MSYLERLKKLNIPHIPTAITDTSTSVSCVSTYSEHIPENQFLATPATEGIQPIENVVVAAKPNPLPDSQMTQREEKAIRSWLAFIEETDSELIDEVITRCRSDMEARRYFLSRSDEVLKETTNLRRQTCTV